MSRTGTDLVKHLGELAFATRLKRLAESLQSDVARIYREMDVDFEPKWFTMLYALYYNDTMSVIELANLLGLTHPAVIQFADQMQRKKLLQTHRDKNDARKKLLQLTTKGRQVFEAIEPVLQQIEIANRELLHETQTDVLGTVEKLEHLLGQKSMYQRVQQHLKEAFRQRVKIVPYAPALKKFFRQLNEEWLGQFFTIEPVDRQVLDHPSREIMAHQGQILFAQVDGQTIGTCAVRQSAPATFELLKMGVTEKYQSKGVGRLLAQEAIAFAQSHHAKTVELYTSRKLDKAISLYQSLGFKITDEQPKGTYERSTIKMKMDLHAVVMAIAVGSAFLLWGWWMLRLHMPGSEAYTQLPFHHFLPGASFIHSVLNVFADSGC